MSVPTFLLFLKVCWDQLTPTNATDVVLASLVYQTGPLGNFYQPTSSALLNVGSRYATNAGLYHFTCTTNQTKEADSIVDIGLHYIALDQNLLPLDTDAGGLFDYWEDLNGNGSQDEGETSFVLADTDGDGVSDFLEVTLGGDPLVQPVSDTNSLINLRVFTPLK